MLEKYNITVKKQTYFSIGTSINKIKYRMMPMPFAKINNTKNILTNKGSIPKCLAKPPQTPAIILLVLER